MKNIKRILFYSSILFISIFYVSCSKSGKYDALNKSIEVKFSGDAQIEVGGPYAGVEFHHSSPMPQRISFFYPVANSIDLSTDYWRRDTTFVMNAGIQVGTGKKEWIGLKPYSFTSTPYSVNFHNEDSLSAISIKYNFCLNEPAMVVTYTITNKSNKKQWFEFYTHLQTSLKTSHTYALKDSAWTEFDKDGSSLITNYDDSQTQNAQIFVANAGEKPDSYNTLGSLESRPSPHNWWIRNYSSLPEKLFSKNNPGIPAASFLYKKNLSHNDKMTIVQIIGSSKKGGAKDIIKYLLDNYKDEVNDFKDSVLSEISNGKFVTGDSVMDKTYLWSKAILAVNKHYIDAKIVPMPCPAEYNFYFTHDVLVTDYAAVNFNCNRVKNDLNFIINHANSNYIIPHAYYWKDSSYKTEYASSDNWNNFWFVIVAGSYLRHSADTKFVSKIYPYISKCIEQTLKNKKADDLMWEAHLDGSDLGNSYGPRAFMTSLSIKALREYVYISSVLGKNESVLIYYQNLASEMQKQLNAKLWSEKQKYLINYYAGGKIDTHYYTGSLIAPHFKILNSQRMDELVNSATYYLLDPKIGIYSIYPMDLNKLKSFLKLKGDEAGKPYYYANGGVWMHANAWFALSLIVDGKYNEAYNFIRKLMTLNGIINSPNGQPAMYEYRISDPNNPAVYGKIDKPQFLWAAGWYIYSIYHLYGISESTWNIVLKPYLPSKQKSCNFSLLVYGHRIGVNITGHGKYIKSIYYDGHLYPSAVIPHELLKLEEVNVNLGKPEIPYVSKCNSILISASYDKSSRELELNLNAFPEHASSTQIICSDKPKHVFLNGKEISEGWNVSEIDGAYILKINFIHSDENISLAIQY